MFYCQNAKSSYFWAILYLFCILDILSAFYGNFVKNIPFLYFKYIPLPCHLLHFSLRQPSFFIYFDPTGYPIPWTGSYHIFSIPLILFCLCAQPFILARSLRLKFGLFFSLLPLLHVTPPLLLLS